MYKIKFIDLFAGCGGLSDGFLQTGKFDDIASVEWLKPQVETLRNRLKTRWGILNSNETVLHFDIQDEERLFNGWKDDEKFGSSNGLDYLVKKADGVDVLLEVHLVKPILLRDVLEMKTECTMIIETICLNII